MNKNVYIMIGVPGGGKSTWIRNNIHGKTLIASADHFFEDEQGKYNFDKSKLPAAHKQSFNRFIQGLEDPEIENVVLDNTNTKKKSMRDYVMEANLRGYPVTIVVIQADINKAAARNTHGVPLETIARMNDEIQNTLKMGFPDSWDIKEVRVVKDA